MKGCRFLHYYELISEEIMYDISFIEPSLVPRERLVSEGVDKLSHQELLSILLRLSNKKKSVYEIAQGLLSSVNSLKELNQVT